MTNKRINVRAKCKTPMCDWIIWTSLSDLPTRLRIHKLDNNQHQEYELSVTF